MCAELRIASRLADREEDPSHAFIAGVAGNTYANHVEGCLPRRVFDDPSFALIPVARTQEAAEQDGGSYVAN